MIKQELLTNDSFVPKPRSLITISRSELTITEAKILNYFVWKHFKREKSSDSIKNSDKEQTYYVTTLAEIRQMIQYTNRSTKRLLDSLFSLAQKTAIYDVLSMNGDTLVKCADGVMTFLDFIEVKEGKKKSETIVHYSLGKKFLEKIELMLAGKEQYYSFDYNILSAFTSKYGLAVYELLKLYEHNEKSVYLEINDNFLRFLGTPKGYKKNQYELKRHVFNPAIEQINNLTSLNVSYEIVEKQGRKYLLLKRESEVDRKDIFIFAATHIYKAKNPKAYAKTLQKKYKEGEIDQDKLSEWEKAYEKHLQKKKEKQEIPHLNQRLHKEIEKVCMQLYPQSKYNRLYIRVPIKGLLYRIELSKLDEYESLEPGIVKKTYSAFVQAKSKEDFIKKYIERG